jgi:hypothetical protein
MTTIAQALANKATNDANIEGGTIYVARSIRTLQETRRAGQLTAEIRKVRWFKRRLRSPI